VLIGKDVVMQSFFLICYTTIVGACTLRGVKNKNLRVRILRSRRDQRSDTGQTEVH
jgi:hypothetical protein